MWVAINDTMSVNAAQLAACAVEPVSGEGDGGSWELQAILPNGARICLMVGPVEACLNAKTAVDTAVRAKRVTHES